METAIRLFTKSITWQLSGLVVMTLVGYLFTNSISASGGIAVVSGMIGFVSYFLHEMIWSKVGWGRNCLPVQAAAVVSASGPRDPKILTAARRADN